MSKHTPGPWVAELHEHGGFEITGRGGHGNSDAYVICGRNWHAKKGETQANAHLIKAAPLMLEALEEVRERLADHPAYAELTEAEEEREGGDTAELSYLVRTIDAAIRAAKGEA